jgi:hypothetical protein
MNLPLDSLALAGAVGVLSGMDTAIWGMYKDASHEGFTAARFARSVVVGAVAAIVIQAAVRLALPSAAAIVVLFGLAYATERGIVEVWKTFVRVEDQSKYFIPMQFSIRGVPVASRGARLTAGTLYVAVVALCVFAVSRLDGPTVERGSLVAGAIIAVGGAWKDAPKEGFQLLKFFRSPCMTVTFAVLLGHLTGSYLQATVAAIGYERATVEMYKTFFFPSRPRGKFAGKPVLYPEMLVRRRQFVPVYFAIKTTLLVLAAVALRDVTPRDGSSRQESPSVSP